jgi:hypothetical protein
LGAAVLEVVRGKTEARVQALRSMVLRLCPDKVVRALQLLRAWEAAVVAELQAMGVQRAEAERHFRAGILLHAEAAVVAVLRVQALAAETLVATAAALQLS